MNITSYNTVMYNNPLLRPPRPFYLLIFLGCTGLLSFGYYLQFYEGLEPCPLCIFQRIAYILIALTALTGLLHGAQGIGLRIYSGLITMIALIGDGIAGWQVRLQHLPPEQVPECGPGLDYMLDMFPLMDTIKMAFSGSGECAEVDWTFLTFSIAEWSLVCFTLLVILSVIHCTLKKLINIKGVQL